VFYLGGNPVQVDCEDGAAFIANSTTVSFHNKGSEVKRSARRGGGDFSNWFAVNPEWL
jgi:hypothetical protein